MRMPNMRCEIVPVYAVRPGDEVRVSWREGGVERSCWARVTRPDAVRPEHDEGVRQSWAARYT